MAFLTLVVSTVSERLVAWLKSIFQTSDDLLEVQRQKTDSELTTIYTLYQEVEGGVEPLDVCFRSRENAEDFMRSQVGIITLMEVKLVDLEIYDETNSKDDETSSEEDEIPRLTLT
jgi:hypothetical protein